MVQVGTSAAFGGWRLGIVRLLFGGWRLGILRLDFGGLAAGDLGTACN